VNNIFFNAIVFINIKSLRKKRSKEEK